MRIVRIDGGLGNQMFCYAFALALRESSGEEVLIDSHRYAFFPNHNGYELGRLFDISLREATYKELWKVTNVARSVFMSRVFYYLPKRRTEIIEKYTEFYPSIVEEARKGYYIGNWQCYKYFDKIKDVVFRQFQFKNELDKCNAELQKALRVSNSSVSIHVRRGDYLAFPQYMNICGLDYYRRAIERAKIIVGESPRFAIFSNDIGWCRENILPLCGENSEVTFVDWNKGSESHKDMRLMSVCRVNIIANSSFSWWGAYLNQRDDRHVIAPSKWINRPLNYRIQCDDWECI